LKLLIEVEFGNDAMLRYSQVRTMLRDGLGTSDHRARPKVGDGSTLRDVNGNRVGSWAVVDEEKLDAEIVELLWDSLRRDPEHKDRRVTNWGTKTMVGLAASIRRICGGGYGQ
jgi:hypothetical protein